MIFRVLRFRVSNLKVPVVNIEPFIKTQKYVSECDQIADAFHNFGCVIIKDPRTDNNKNIKFIDLMQRYFTKRQKQLDAKQMVDVFPQYQYQVGITPQFALRIKDHTQLFSHLSFENRPFTPSPIPYDCKYRYLWNIGHTDKDVAPNQIPSDFPQFEQIMNGWGQELYKAVTTIAEMVAVGFKLSRLDIFSQKMIGGHNKLAPSVSDITRYKKGDMFSSLHYDFGFLTIHGKSKFPGLYIWLRSGEKVRVQIPDNHLLIQAGKQFEYLTGGFVQSGYHEVAYDDYVQSAKIKSLQRGEYPWRISSTMFSHLRGNTTLQPLQRFRNIESLVKYPQIQTSKYFIEELKTNHS